MSFLPRKVEARITEENYQKLKKVAEESPEIENISHAFRVSINQFLKKTAEERENDGLL